MYLKSTSPSAKRDDQIAHPRRAQTCELRAKRPMIMCPRSGQIFFYITRALTFTKLGNFKVPKETRLESKLSKIRSLSSYRSYILQVKSVKSWTSWLTNILNFHFSYFLIDQHLHIGEDR